MGSHPIMLWNYIWRHPGEEKYGDMNDKHVCPCHERRFGEALASLNAAIDILFYFYAGRFINKTKNWGPIMMKFIKLLF